MSKSPFFLAKMMVIYFFWTPCSERPDKAQQSLVYMIRCKKSQIAQPCKRTIFQQTNNSYQCKNHHFWRKLWSYLFFGHPVGPNKSQLSDRPMCFGEKSSKLLNLVEEIFISRPIIVTNVKITIFQPKLWSYSFFGLPVGPNKAQQLQVYMAYIIIKKKSEEDKSQVAFFTAQNPWIAYM